APQIRSNFFPGIKTISRIAGAHGLRSAVPFGCPSYGTTFSGIMPCRALPLESQFYREIQSDS
ncbi:MAG: hypothetical protein ACXVIO_15690, partial [Candidatus Angelobacter sp.]